MSEADKDAGGPMLSRVFDALRAIQEELRDQRKWQTQATSLLVGLSEQVQRLDRRIGELDRRMGELDRHIGELDRRITEQKDDLEVMIRAELMGQNAMLRAELGSRFDALADRVAILEGRDPWQEAVRSGPRP